MRHTITERDRETNDQNPSETAVTDGAATWAEVALRAGWCWCGLSHSANDGSGHREPNGKVTSSRT